MNILRGVVGFKINDYDDPDAMVELVLRNLKPLKLCKTGDKCIVVCARYEDSQDETNTINVYNVD